MKDFFHQVKKTSLNQDEVYSLVNQFIEEEKIIEQTSAKDLSAIATFLWQSRNYKALKLFLQKSFKRVSNLSGDSLFHFIHFFKEQNPHLEISDFEELNEVVNIFKPYKCPYKIKNYRFEEQENLQIEVFEKRHHEIKEDLVDKLEFVRAQRLDKAAVKTLEKLLEAFPDDPRFVKEKQSMFESEAGKIIDLYARKKTEQKSNFNILEPKKESTSQIYDLFKDSFQAKDILYLVEVFALAHETETVIEIFEAHPNLKNEHFWLYIDHLIKIERYLEALAELKKNQKKFESSTESIFTFYYYHAICLWYLNDKSLAMEIMKSIHKTKPNFRQTTFYLNLWHHNEKTG